MGKRKTLPPLSEGEQLPFEVEVYIEANGDVTFADLADQIIELAALIRGTSADEIREERQGSRSE